MKRGKLPGVATASKRLADGTKRKYYYAWRGGPMLKADDGTPLLPKDPQFVVAYAAAHAERKKPAQGTLFSLIAAYKSSTEFTGRAEVTKKSYRRYLKMIEEEFGTMPLAVVEHRKARGEFKKWRDGMAVNPRKADLAWTVLARVLSVAKDRGLISTNVCERGGRLYEADRAENHLGSGAHQGVLWCSIARTTIRTTACSMDRPTSGYVDLYRLEPVRRHPHSIAAEQAASRKKEKANRRPGGRAA